MFIMSDWKNFININGDFELPNFLYRTINDLMKQALDMGTLLSDDPYKLRAYKEQTKKLFKNKWYDLAQALEFFEIIFRSGELVIFKKSSGKAGSNYTCDELFNDGYRLYIKPEKSEEVVELTLEEIAKLKGIDVKNLRIKE